MGIITLRVASMEQRKPFTYILLFISAHFFHHLLTALVVPLLPSIRDGFGLTYAQAGLVVSAFTLAYGIGQLPAGWLADRIGPKFVLTVGVAGITRRQHRSSPPRFRRRSGARRWGCT